MCAPCASGQRRAVALLSASCSRRRLGSPPPRRCAAATAPAPAPPAAPPEPFGAACRTSVRGSHVTAYCHNPYPDADRVRLHTDCALWWDIDADAAPVEVGPAQTVTAHRSLLEGRPRGLGDPREGPGDRCSAVFEPVPAGR